MGAMRKSRLSRYKQDRLIEHFVAGTTARTAASLCSVNRKLPIPAHPVTCSGDIRPLIPEFPGT